MHGMHEMDIFSPSSLFPPLRMVTIIDIVWIDGALACFPTGERDACE